MWLENVPAFMKDSVGDGVPFSFRFDGNDSSQWLGTCGIEHSSNSIDSDHSTHTITYLDSDTGMEVVCEAIVYSDFPAVEWVHPDQV